MFFASSAQHGLLKEKYPWLYLFISLRKIANNFWYTNAELLISFYSEVYNASATFKLKSFPMRFWLTRSHLNNLPQQTSGEISTPVLSEVTPVLALTECSFPPRKLHRVKPTWGKSWGKTSPGISWSFILLHPQCEKGL